MSERFRGGLEISLHHESDVSVMFVSSHVTDQITSLYEGLIAHFTEIRLLPRVSFHVPRHAAKLAQQLSAHRTGRRLRPTVGF